MCEGTFIYPNYKAISIVAGTPNTLAFSAFNNIFRNYQVSAGVNFTLSTTFLRNGGQYRLLVTKTIVGDVTITLPAGSVVTGDPGATTMTLSGANGEKFMIIFSFDEVNQIFSMGGTPPGVSPGTPSNFSNNVIPYINGSGEWDEDTNFSYTSGNLNVGAGVINAARVSVYGNSDVSGNGLRVGNLTGTARLTIGNNGEHGINSSPVANKALVVKGLTDAFAESAFRAENLSGTAFFDINNAGRVEQRLVSGGSNITYHSWNNSATPILALQASGSATGLWFSGSANKSIGYEGNTISLKGGFSTSNVGTSNAAVSIVATGGTIGASNVYYDFGLLIKTYNNIAGANVKILRIRESVQLTGTGTGSFTFIENTPTINQTGGSASIIGYNYDPTLTSILGAHYGLLIRPKALNGLGLEASLPTALLHIGASTAERASLRIDAGVAPTAPNEGDIWSDGTSLYMHIGGVDREFAFVS